MQQLYKMNKQNTDLDKFKRDHENQSNLHNHTKRSMVTKEENPHLIIEPNIDDILALQLSDTLMDAAYHLSAVRISMALHMICDPFEKQFFAIKSWSFQNIKMFSNRAEAAQIQQIKNKPRSASNYQKSQQQKKQGLTLNNIVIGLTTGQKISKISKNIVLKLNKFIKILNRKILKYQIEAFIRISQWDSKKQEKLRKQSKNQIQQNFERYQTRMRERLKKFERRSIGKNQNKKSLNTSSFSLDKSQYKSQKLLEQAKSPQKAINKVSTRTGTLSSASKESPNQPKSYKISPQKGHIVRKTSPNAAKKYLSKQLKSSHAILKTTKNIDTPDNSLSSSLVNSQNLQSVSKEKQLSYLRKKYYKLVEEFRQFSQRFLKVIKQE